MDIVFSWGWFFSGIGLIVVATLFIRFHQWIADNFGRGVIDYDKYKLIGVIAVALGFATMLNLVPIFLTIVFSAIFGRN